MNRPIWRVLKAPAAAVAALALATGLSALAVPAVSAVAATSISHTAGLDPFSPEAAGYAVSGAQFRYGQQTVYLRNPTQYAANFAGFGYSVQLWSSSRVIVLGVSDATTGGNFSPGIAVFNPATHAILCAEATCPGYPAGWNAGQSYTPGDTLTESVYYNRDSGVVTLTVHDLSAGTSSAATYDAGVGQSFNQVRFGSEAGDTPWSTVAYTAPISPVLWGRFSAAQVTNYKGHQFPGLTGYFTTEKITMTSDGTSAGTVEANSSALNTAGNGFTTSLQP